MLYGFVKINNLFQNDLPRYYNGEFTPKSRE